MLDASLGGPSQWPRAEVLVPSHGMPVSLTSAGPSTSAFLLHLSSHRGLYIQVILQFIEESVLAHISVPLLTLLSCTLMLSLQKSDYFGYGPKESKGCSVRKFCSNQAPQISLTPSRHQIHLVFQRMISLRAGVPIHAPVSNVLNILCVLDARNTAMNHPLVNLQLSWKIRPVLELLQHQAGSKKRNMYKDRVPL